MISTMLGKTINAYVKHPNSQKLAPPPPGQVWSEGLHHLLGSINPPQPSSQAPSTHGTPAGSLLRAVDKVEDEGQVVQQPHHPAVTLKHESVDLPEGEFKGNLDPLSMEEEATVGGRGRGEGTHPHPHHSRAVARSSAPLIDYSLLSGKKQKLEGDGRMGGGSEVVRGKVKGRGPGRPASAHRPPGGTQAPLGAPQVTLNGTLNSSYPAALAFTGALLSRCSASVSGRPASSLPFPLPPLSHEELDQVAAVNPIVAANAALIISAREDEMMVGALSPRSGTQGSWKALDEATGVLAMAPDDEVLAELLACQSELMQQVAVNRARSQGVMLRALDDLPAQKKKREEVREMEADVLAYLSRKAELKRQQRKEMRDMQKRQAMGLAGLLVTGEGEGPALPFIPPELQSTLLDPLTTRGPQEDTLCVVCGEGTSQPPNQILYCERCDMAVHQHCYGLGTVPQGEWLCWPCLKYEGELMAKGVPPEEIRPPSWAKAGGGGGGVARGLLPLTRFVASRTRVH